MSNTKILLKLIYNEKGNFIRGTTAIKPNKFGDGYNFPSTLQIIEDSSKLIKQTSYNPKKYDFPSTLQIIEDSSK